MSRKPISESQLDDANRLKELWQTRKNELFLTQAKVAEAIGVTQGAINGYLNGSWPLNIKVAMIFARELHCRVADFSPSIQSEIDAIAAYSTSQSASTLALLQSIEPNINAWPFLDIKAMEIDNLSLSDKLKLEGFIKGYLMFLKEQKR